MPLEETIPIVVYGYNASTIIRATRSDSFFLPFPHVPCLLFSFCYQNIYNLRSKIMLYMIWVAGEDVDVQRKGLVFLVRFSSNYELSVYDIRRIRNAPHGHISVSISVRPCAVHICSPCSTLYRLSHAFILLRIKQEGRMKIKIHYGTYRRHSSIISITKYNFHFVNIVPYQ